MILRWNVAAIARHMKRHRLANANRLGEFVGLTVPTAYSVLDGHPLERSVHVPTWKALVRAFGVKNPCTLVTWTPDE